MIFVAALAGYLIGSLPTANGLGRMWGVDLRTGGSGNPGANNARRLGGYSLAAAVLLSETAKGVAAVGIGLAGASAWGAAAAGIGAAAGNVYNVWYRFKGGKGLAISLGILLAVWPMVVPAVLAMIAVFAIITRSSGIAAIATLAGLAAAGPVWHWLTLDNGWGIPTGGPLTFLGFGLALVLWQKHWRDARRRLTESPQSETR